jgi:hypothetical protein
MRIEKPSLVFAYEECLPLLDIVRLHETTELPNRPVSEQAHLKTIRDKACDLAIFQMLRSETSQYASQPRQAYYLRFAELILKNHDRFPLFSAHDDEQEFDDRGQVLSDVIRWGATNLVTGSVAMQDEVSRLLDTRQAGILQMYGDQRHTTNFVLGNVDRLVGSGRIAADWSEQLNATE